MTDQPTTPDPALFPPYGDNYVAQFRAALADATSMRWQSALRSGDPVRWLATLDVALARLGRAEAERDALRERAEKADRGFDDYLRNLAESVGVPVEEVEAEPAHGNQRLRWAAMIQLKISALRERAKEIEKAAIALCEWVEIHAPPEGVTQAFAADLRAALREKGAGS